MTIQSLVTALGARRTGVGWVARCPAHDDREPSLSIAQSSDGKVLVHCHAGCDQLRVINSLATRGCWGIRCSQPRPLREPPFLGDLSESLGRHERTAAALRIWAAAVGATGTVGEAYLRSRGITVTLPPTLRVHPMLTHASGRVLPALVALVTRGSDDAPLGIHRTFLNADGIGKAQVEPRKMMLGPCRGGAVRLAECQESVMIGEGIETCLSAMQGTGRPAWAALSTSGLRGLVLPPSIREVIVLADGDDAGEAAALDAAQRWSRENRSVRIARPPQDLDFNDLLLGRRYHEALIS